MKVLIIDTALDACTAAVFADAAMIAERVEPMARGHQERIGVLVRDVVAASGGFDAIDRIGVTVGPGSFTGLRVGLAFAQGLGVALDRPVLGLSTLQALAEDFPSADEAPDRRAAVIDARRGQVYLQAFDGAAPLDQPAPWDIKAAQTYLAEQGVKRLIGSGAGLVASPGMTIVDTTHAAPRALAALTARLDPASAPARPLYLRAPDAAPPTRLPGQARVRVS